MLSVCIITKNEEHNLARCLKSFQNTGFELIVADTGSTDQTKKIAAEYTETVSYTHLTLPTKRIV